MLRYFVYPAGSPPHWFVGIFRPHWRPSHGHSVLARMALDAVIRYIAARLDNVIRELRTLRRCVRAHFQICVAFNTAASTCRETGGAPR
jgi:hypothetical protein